jgi:hypothetical protein
MGQMIMINLNEKYPKIINNTEICVGDGWIPLLDKTCYIIQSNIDWTIECKKRDEEYNKMAQAVKNYDHSLFEEFFKAFFDTKGVYTPFLENKLAEVFNGEFRVIQPVCPQVVAVQIKEKFGSLRFYYDGGNQFCRGVISLAEEMSACICEVCGDFGKMRKGGWIRTLCDKHVEKD